MKSNICRAEHLALNFAVYFLYGSRDWKMITFSYNMRDFKSNDKPYTYNNGLNSQRREVIDRHEAASWVIKIFFHISF